MLTACDRRKREARKIKEERKHEVTKTQESQKIYNLMSKCVYNSEIIFYYLVNRTKAVGK